MFIHTYIYIYISLSLYIYIYICIYIYIYTHKLFCTRNRWPRSQRFRRQLFRPTRYCRCTQRSAWRPVNKNNNIDFVPSGRTRRPRSRGLAESRPFPRRSRVLRGTAPARSRGCFSGNEPIGASQRCARRGACRICNILLQRSSASKSFCCLITIKHNNLCLGVSLVYFLHLLLNTMPFLSFVLGTACQCDYLLLIAINDNSC